MHNVLFHAGLNSTSSWQSKTVGGSKDERRVSFLASISNATLRQLCTGSVISTLYILSAASCIYYHTFHEKYDSLSAFIGKKKREILFMEYHPSYVFESNAFDVGLIRVSSLKTSEDIILFSMHF